MSARTRSSRRAQVVLPLAVLVTLTLGALGFACGSNDDGPGACVGAACNDGGSEASTVDGPARPDGSVTDAPPDTAPCAYATRDPDAGPSGTLQWALRFGLTGYSAPTTVATDPTNGDVVLTGGYWGTIDFGGGPLVSQAPLDASGTDVFVARFDKGGKYKWARRAGNGLSNSASGAAVDGAGNVLIVGVFRGTIDLGGPLLPGVGEVNAFLVKFDKDGNYLWGRSFGTAGQTSVWTTVAVDSKGNAVVAGLGTSLNVGGGAISGFLLAQFNASGGHVWSKGYSSTTSQGGPYAVVDNADNLIVAGNFDDAIDLGGGPLKTKGAPGQAMYVAKLDPSGKHLWSHQYGEGLGARTANLSAGGLAADRCGNVILHGPFFGDVDFGAGLHSSKDATKDTAFVARISPSGAGLWSKVVFATSSAAGGAFGLGRVGVDALGGITIAPVLVGDGVGAVSTADFGGGPLTSVVNAGGSVAIASFEQSANHRWSYAGGAPSTATSSAASPGSIATWGSSIIVAGQLSGCKLICTTSPPGTTLVLAGKTLTAVSGADTFLASFTP